MEKNRSKRDPLPEGFKTVEEFNKFWETHDTEDYPEAWREVQVTVSMRRRKYPRIVLDANLARELDERARERGISLNKLVNQLLKENLKHSAH